ncbi:serine hydrolase [Sphingomonas sp. MAH-20]|uniref:Serine hydrolase n=1 Tax=Sphingomonas horti TaxID=2682842 RepID=A0A6I4IWF8_9SPHN|nr:MULTISPECIES: serine hydrolase domain-containing protein [Sphingomonas]MBA2920164.1 serine hydrolase [Sphingomonas sp. CGMCC 1.13658]MVO76419.1 serine hydrolase [Sphingomonas horti]
MRTIKSITAGVLALAATVALAQQGQKLAPTLAPTESAQIAPAPPVTPPPQPGGHALTKVDVDAWLDGYMPYALHSGDIPGAVVTIVKDGQIVTARGFGYADVAKRTPVDPAKTLFRPGSVSKLVTWTAVMQLVEAGKLDLDRDVNAYLDFKIPPRKGQPATLREIMTHTAGFEEHAKDIIFYDADHLKSLEQYLKSSAPERIYDAGTTPAYSNWATALAGYIVQRVSGEPFDDYVERHIFAPLGMTDSTFRQPLPARLVPQMATGYAKPGKADKFEIVGPAPAGSLSAPGIDMARFMLAHLQGGELNGKRILSAQTAATMHNSPLARVNPYSLIPPLNRMELGFFETNINGREVIGHLGDTSAFHTSLHLFINDGVGLYVSFNSPGKQGAVGALRGALFQDFADRYFPSTTKDGQVDQKTAAEHARMMAGVWENSRRSESSFLKAIGLFGQTKVTVGPKGELVVPELKGLNGRVREWVEIAPFVWREKGGHERLAAKVVDGKVVRWSFDMISPFMVFDRVPASLSSAWILPALYLSIAVLLLTFLYWPVAWAIRRRYKAPVGVSGRALQAYRATRIMAGLDLAVLIGWLVVISMLFSSLENLAGAFDFWLWLLQIAGAIIFVGAVLISGWNLWLTWRDGRRWTRKLWSLLVFLSTLLVLYVAIAFRLIAMTVSY